LEALTRSWIDIFKRGSAFNRLIGGYQTNQVRDLRGQRRTDFGWCG